VKYFLDTEFIEKPGSIQLISIGIVSEDERTFYAENVTFDERDADDWVTENVLEHLRWWNVSDHTMSLGDFAHDDKCFEVFGNQTLIKSSLLYFFRGDLTPEFWGYYADYDWVVFCWIFGRMVDLPKHFPKYCRDLKQLLDESGKTKLPDPEGEHNALDDALWNWRLYKHLTE
jgi:hypothetical protein